MGGLRVLKTGMDDQFAAGHRASRYCATLWACSATCGSPISSPKRPRAAGPATSRRGLARPSPPIAWLSALTHSPNPSGSARSAPCSASELSNGLAAIRPAWAGPAANERPIPAACPPPVAPPATCSPAVQCDSGARPNRRADAAESAAVRSASMLATDAGPGRAPRPTPPATAPVAQRRAPPQGAPAAPRHAVRMAG